ncbi:MAG TPA: NAD-dependent epimerase/dehydratase family protein, partial [Thermoleophilaceae bacterium]|nr:NAD-dependent epimerase/dehydratase family protein [Thermoleophilaceae bacterium]
MSAGRYAGVTTLVTGAQGFLGSWLVERLLDEGARVVAPRRDVPALSRFRLDRLDERCDLVEADVLDEAALARVVNEYAPELVFHLAAQTIVGTANRAPLATFETNVRGTWNLLEACRSLAEQSPVRAVVVASSDKAYGAHDELPYREDHSLRPDYPYDVSKACADLVARSYAHTYGLPVAVTRLGNIYGPGDFNLSRLVPDTACALVRGERPVVGSDGTPQRDFVHVADAVAAYLAVADSLARSKLRGRAWNAGGGEPVAVIEVVERLIAASGRDLAPDVRGAGS